MSTEIFEYLYIFSLPLALVIIGVIIYLVGKHRQKKTPIVETPLIYIQTELYNVSVPIKSSDLFKIKEAINAPGTGIWVVGHKSSYYKYGIVEAICKDYEGNQYYLDRFNNKELFSTIKTIAAKKQNTVLVIDDYNDCMKYNPKLVDTLANLINAASNHDVEVKILIVADATIYNSIKVSPSLSDINCHFIDIRAIEDMVFAQRKALIGRAAH